VRDISAQGDQTERTTNISDGLTNGRHKVTGLFVEKSDQLGERLRIGFALEDDALFFEKLTDGAVVFDDAIVDDRNAIACIEVRMGVDLAWAAVRGPTGMRDPICPGAGFWERRSSSPLTLPTDRRRCS